MNYRKVQKKIKTVGNVKKITKAMQMVSAVKMKKSTQAALDSRYYASTLETMLSKVIASYDLDSTKITWNQQNDPVKPALYILISSNKGLCGSFNFNLFKAVLQKVKIDNSLFITLGRKGFEFVNRIGGKVSADFSTEKSFINAGSAIFNLVKQQYLNNEVSSVTIIYNQFVSAFINTPVISQMLPLVRFEEFTDEKSELIKGQSDYLIEPLDISFINSLIEDLFVQKIRKAILDSEASEYSSRMISMKNATDNANDLILNLTLVRNKLRQTSITNELLEMTAAKESTENS